MPLRNFSCRILGRLVPAATRRAAPVRGAANARVVDLRTDSRDEASAEMLRYMVEEKVTMKGESLTVRHGVIPRCDFRLLRTQAAAECCLQT